VQLLLRPVLRVPTTFYGASYYWNRLEIWHLLPSRHLPSTENASSTFPGIPPHTTYPEFTKSIPPPMAGPPPSSEPPLASTPLTVLYGPTVSKSHKMAPSLELYARRCPSTDPENAAPGIALTAADCAGLHLFLSPHPGGGAYQRRSPLSRLRAKRPPPCLGSASVPSEFGNTIRPISDKPT